MAKSALGGDCGEARGASGCEWPAGEPSGEAVEVDGCGGCKALEAGLGQAVVAGLAQAEGAPAL